MKGKKQKSFLIFAGIILFLADILIGMSDINFKDILDAIFNYSNSNSFYRSYFLYIYS